MNGDPLLLISFVMMMMMMMMIEGIIFCFFAGSPHQE